MKQPGERQPEDVGNGVEEKEGQHPDLWREDTRRVTIRAKLYAAIVMTVLGPVITIGVAFAALARNSPATPSSTKPAAPAAAKSSTAPANPNFVKARLGLVRAIWPPQPPGPAITAGGHFHGATPTTAMTHIAIQEKLNGSPVTWMEKVSDEQYNPR